MKLFIDDIRDAPEGYTLVRTVDEAISFIERYGFQIQEISFDHDISLEVIVADKYRPFPSPETYRAVARYVRAFYANDDWQLWPKITLHSANPDGRAALAAILKGFDITEKPYGPAFRKKS